MITLAALQGHWRRDWLTAPGVRDDTTRVHWMQAGALYADVRVPAARPDLGDATCPADLSDEGLAALLAAEGFAGTVDLAGDVCTWHRAVNWHGRTEAVDAGRLRFTPEGALHEAGVHADYAELWRHEAAGPAEGLRLEGEGVAAFLVTVGARFVFGAGAPGAPATGGLADAVRGGARPAALRALLGERVHALGVWEGATGAALLATNPFAEGRPILTRTEGGATWHALVHDGAARDVTLRAV